MKTNTDLQALVDKAARKGGGTVKIPAGIYLLNDALHLRSGVHLVGKAKLKQPAKFPGIGPEAAPLDAARHIHIERLPR